MQKLVVVVRVCICKVKPVDIRLTNTSIADRQRFMQLLVKHGIKVLVHTSQQKMVDTLFMQTLVEKDNGGPSGSRRSSYGWQQSVLKPLGYIV